MVSPILVALDVPDAGSALALAETTAPYVGGFKVGLELLSAEGPGVISIVAATGLPVFADVKLHDIPNTVRGAARGLARAGARWVTVHGTGGAAMVEAAVEGLDDGGHSEAGALVVTVLTSLTGDDLAEVGLTRAPGDQVAALTGLAARAGAEGVVCAVSEAGRAREAAPGLKVVTPGIRAQGGPADDQRRVATLSEALAAGADMVVVGRLITRADDVAAAARSLAAEAAAFSRSH